jgi:hypothetical protein
VIPRRRGPRPTGLAGTAFGILLAVAVLVGIVPAGPLSPPPVRAATPDLTIVADATYEVLPDAAQVSVTADLTLTNRLVDTATRRYYFDRAFLAVLPGTEAFAIESLTGGFRPTVRVSAANADYTVLRIDFGAQLASGRTAEFRLRFSLPDPGGAADRTLRIGQTLVSFPVWGFATDETSGGSVRVILPGDFSVTVARGELAGPEPLADGRQAFESGSLTAPLDFFAYLTAERSGAYLESTVRVDYRDRVGWIRVRAWPDDPAWAERMVGLIGRAAPALDAAIGRSPTIEGTLVVEEAITRSTGGYAGLYDPTENRIQINYQADDLVAIHETAHAWFNGRLLADRWANEAFASWYALRVADELGLLVEPPPPVSPEAQAARIPLNAWGLTSVLDGEPDIVDEYAYAASLELAAAIAAEAGPEALQAVWRDAATGIGAYQPPQLAADPTDSLSPDPGVLAPGTEPAQGPPDWRGLLDLLEDRTGRRFDRLWRVWVVRSDEANVLEDRRRARELYAEVVDAAGEWALPVTVRDALRGWHFELATELLLDARAVLIQRDELDAAAADARLTLPVTLRQAFERDGTFGRAATEAAEERAAIDAIRAAQAARLADPDPVEALGLYGSRPEADLADAEVAFTTGDLAGAIREAAAARDGWLEALETGRRRALSLLALAAAALLGVLAVLAHQRGRRRGRRAVAEGPAGPAQLDPGGPPYATLAATRPPESAEAEPPAEE